MLSGIWTRFAVWGVIAALTLTASTRSLGLIVWIVGLLTVYSVAGGVANLPLNRVVAETIPPDRRSSFFGWRLFCGGILAMLAGYLVKRVMGSTGLEWPTNYGVLFLLSFMTLGVAYTAMSLLQFSRSEEIPTNTNTPSLLEEARSCFRAYPVLRRLVFVEILSGGITLLLPFLAIYGTEELGFALSWIGLLIIAQKAGSILGNLLWMPLGNKQGTRLVIRLGLVSGLLGAVVVWTVHTPLGFTLAFALLGLAQSGTQVGFSGYILEIGHHEVRPLLIAIEQTLLIPLYFAPVLGGVLADQLGYASMAVAATLLLGVALYLAYRLCEPRNGDPRCEPCGTVELTHLTRQES
jgi:MFS family permease